jgi:hypothetical protein
MFAESFLMLSPSGTQAGNLAHHSDNYDAESIIPPDWPKSMASR